MNVRLSTAFVCLATLLLLVGSEATAQKKGRRRSRGRNNAQQRAQQEAARRKAAEASLRRAQAQNAVAQQRFASTRQQAAIAQQKTSTAVDLLKAAEDRLQQATQEQEQIEAQLLDAQSDNSPYTVALKNYEASREELQRARNRVENDPKHKANPGVEESPEATQRRKKLLATALLRDSRYLVATQQWKVNKQILDQARGELFRNDSSWNEAVKEAGAARAEQVKAKQLLKNFSLDRASAMANFRKSAKAAAAASQALARAQASMKGLSRNTKKSSSSGKRRR